MAAVTIVKMKLMCANYTVLCAHVERLNRYPMYQFSIYYRLKRWPYLVGSDCPTMKVALSIQSDKGELASKSHGHTLLL